MKRLLSVCLALIMLLSLFGGIAAMAADKLFVATLEYDGKQHKYEGTYFDIQINGKSIETPIPPIVLSNGRSIVPVREIFEALGASVYWTEGKPSRVVIANQNTTVSLAIGNNVAKVNGKDVKMEVAAKLISYDGIGKTMVPIRFVAETLDMQVDYNADKGLISIKDKEEEKAPDKEEEQEEEKEEAVLPENKLVRVVSSLKGDTLQATITFDKPIAKYTYMTLTNPNRVVVDVADAYIATGKYSYTASGNTSKIRLGDYEGKARCVFDVELQPEIKITCSADKKVLTVLLTAEEPSEEEKEEEKLPSTDEKEEEKEETDDGAPIVVIDAGHGGSDPGAIGYDEDGNPLLYEKNVNLNISRQVYQILKEKGVRVYMTRTDDTYVSLSARTEYANKIGADLFISIHCNAFETTDMHGTLVMHHTDESIAEDYGVSGRVVANNILRYLPKALETENKGRINGNAMYVIRKADMPSVIVETAFITNAEDRAKLADADCRSAAAEAIAQGILDTLKDIK